MFVSSMLSLACTNHAYRLTAQKALAALRRRRGPTRPLPLRQKVESSASLMRIRNGSLQLMTWTSGR